jgi:hypothetical protein
VLTKRKRKCAKCEKISTSLLNAIYEMLKIGNYQGIKDLPEVEEGFLNLCGGEQIYLGDCFIFKHEFRRKY